MSRPRVAKTRTYSQASAGYCEGSRVGREEVTQRRDHLVGRLVERDAVEAVDDLVREDQRRRRRDARQWGFAERDTHDPVGMIRGQRVADQQSPNA
jgi:hypothetical protein